METRLTPTSSLPPGLHNVAASYLGDPKKYSASTGALQETISGGTPQANLSATRLQFGDAIFGGTITQTLTLTNIGGGTLTADGCINGPSFTVSGSECKAGITAGKSCTLTVNFDPVSIGGHGDVLTLHTNTSKTFTVALNGFAFGVGPKQTASPMQFSTIAFGTSKILPLTIYNNGVGYGDVTKVTINGPSYKVLETSQNTCHQILYPNQSCILPIEFDPVAVGAHFDIMTISTDSPFGTAISTVYLHGAAK